MIRLSTNKQTNKQRNNDEITVTPHASLNGFCRRYGKDGDERDDEEEESSDQPEPAKASLARRLISEFLALCLFLSLSLLDIVAHSCALSHLQHQANQPKKKEVCFYCHKEQDSLQVSLLHYFNFFSSCFLVLLVVAVVDSLRLID